MCPPQELDVWGLEGPKCLVIICLYFSASHKSYPQLKFVQIYFGTATYDKIDRDEKVTVEAQLGLIGGTMGLLTGFSLLSAVEIVYFAINFFLSLHVDKNHFTPTKSHLMK
jgi:hypothetical protein